MRYRTLSLVVLWLPLLLGGCHDAYKEAAATLPKEKSAAKSEGVPMSMEEVWPKMIPAAANAAPLYDDALTKYEVLVGTSPDLGDLLRAPGDPKESEIKAVAAAINSGNNVFSAIDRALAKPHWQVSHDWGSSDDFEFPEFSVVKKLAKLVRIKADLESIDGQYGDAAQDLGKLLKMARHCSEEPILIGGLVQRAIEL